MPFSRFQFSSLATIPDLAHAFVAKPDNLAPHTGPETDKALPRRRQLCDALGLNFDRLTAPRQVHGVRVAGVDDTNAGAGRDGLDTAIADCDGLMTDLPGVPLIAFSADCCLLLVVEPAARAIGLTHAGWRGVAGGGARALVQAMQEAYGARPDRMIAAIAPAARPCCYEISADLAAQLAETPDCGPDVLARREDRWHLDMHVALRRQLIDAGMPPARIESSDACTICDRRFFSYRREGPQTGRNALLAGWRAQAGSAIGR